MSVVLRMLRWDMVMQYRNGFWLVAIFVMLPWAGLLLALTDDQARFILPALIFLDISIGGALFMAGVYFFEKREGSLYALSVTPIPTWHWLIAKLISLSAIGIVMCVVLTLIGAGIAVPWGQAAVAFLCINVLFTFIGFILAAQPPAMQSFA